MPASYRHLTCAIACMFCACLHTRDEDYVDHVNRRLGRGPIEACCEFRFAGERPERDAECRRNAERDCGFVRGARVTRLTSISRFGDDTGATLSVDIAGPRGRGSCSYQMHRDGSIDFGSCRINPP